MVIKYQDLLFFYKDFAYTAKFLLGYNSSNSVLFYFFSLFLNFNFAVLFPNILSFYPSSRLHSNYNFSRLSIFLFYPNISSSYFLFSPLFSLYSLYSLEHFLWSDTKNRGFIFKTLLFYTFRLATLTFSLSLKLKSCLLDELPLLRSLSSTTSILLRHLLTLGWNTVLKWEIEVGTLRLYVLFLWKLWLQDK